ncbi:phage tail tape measure protein [Pseudomonas sp.]|uniref:phage tail tape measure protein n=1 Tax=Pseudomonas sp. TaxID=306 RepID=UPI003264225D
MSRLNTVDTQSSRTEQKTSTDMTSSTSQELRLTREALTLRDVRNLDPVAAFQQSFTAPLAPEKTITVLREESTKSEASLTKTLEPESVLGEETWLQAKTSVLNSANSWAGESSAAATTVKTAEAVILPVISPVFTGFFSGLGETIKTRVTGNLVDVTLGKLPGAAGKLFKEDGFEKDKTCCCNDATQRSPRSRRTARRSTPGGKKGTQKPKSQRPQKPRKPQKSLKPKNSQHSQKKQAPAARLADAKLVPKKTGGASTLLRGAWQKGVQSLFPAYSSGGNPGAPAQVPQAGGAQTKSRKNNSVPGKPPSGRVPGLTGAVERGLVPLSSEVRTKNLPLTQTVSHERSVAPVAHPPKIPGSGLLGTMSKLESSAARRLGPLRYVDTAMDVIQGVRNGDAKAVGAGLSSAGGAWAGASAGAAIGTLIFPGVGTAVGGAIGGLLGSEAGSWLGGKLFSATDRLPAPDAVSKELNSARTDSVQLTLAPSIQITGVNPADAQQVVNQVIQALQFQCMPMVTDALGMRRNAALADHGGD